MNDLQIIFYPDPRLKKVSRPVDVFDQELLELATRMLGLMRESRGVGLAAPQVGRNVRLFVVNATGKPEDDKIYVNPELFDADGEDLAEEGCLSIPGVNIEVTRAKNVKIRAQDITGKPFEQTDAGYVPRIWQHELDHLNGTLLTDRMGPTALAEHRKTLKELEAKFEAARAAEAVAFPVAKPPTQKKTAKKASKKA
jgi:peptide deformylase